MRLLNSLIVVLVMASGCGKKDPEFTVTYKTTIDNNSYTTIRYTDGTGQIKSLYQQPGNFSYTFTTTQAPDSGSLSLEIGSFNSKTVTAQITINDKVVGYYAGFGNFYGYAKITNNRY